MICLLLLTAASASLVVDRSAEHVGAVFDGLGAISGGGATSRLLPDYAEPSRSQILDYLFKPNFGASLQMLKVEIGGDSQSTDGTESSHMHSKDVVDLHTGYEWWLLGEAKKRNPNIKVYGLAWAFPGWVGNGTGNPFKFPSLTANYLLNWVKGAWTEYNVTVDYLGIWNERASDGTFVQTLRQALNDAGFNNTKLVVKDGDPFICETLLLDKSYRDAVDVIGLHYPTDFLPLYSPCRATGKPIWASEESSSYDDLNGAACWANIVTEHWVLNQMTSSIMWNLVGSYYHGTNWYASSMMTAVEPWSGHYEINPVIWANAHITQFTEVGWRYLANGFGSGKLPGHGYYATFVDPASSNFTMTIVKISHEHARCTRMPLPFWNTQAENVTFTLHESMGNVEQLHVWHSNFESYSKDSPVFEHSIVKVSSGSFTLSVQLGDLYTVTTIESGRKGSFPSIPKSEPSFPLPYSDDFSSTSESQEPRWLADQIGSFEVHVSDDGRKSMKQMVLDLPIGWSDSGTRGPVTLIGMREWSDVQVSVDFKIPSSSRLLGNAACVGVRSDQMWAKAIVLCISGTGNWNLTLGGPMLDGTSTHEFASGHVGVGFETWHRMQLSVQPDSDGKGDVASSSVDGVQLFQDVSVRSLDTGFAVLGANSFSAVEFRNMSIAKAPNGWTPPATCPPAIIGSSVRATPCARNGLVSPDQAFELLASYQIRLVDSDLCASASTNGDLLLQTCDVQAKDQYFWNDYTLVRNLAIPFFLGSPEGKTLNGNLDGTVGVGLGNSSWKWWSYFPNTQQLRNQYTANTNLGFPMCLSACGKATSLEVKMSAVEFV